MITVFFTASLFLFITLCVGYPFKKWFTQSGIFDCFLSGLSAQLVYFNIWSLFSPTNYYALVLPLIFSGVILIKTSFLKHFTASTKQLAEILFSKRNATVSISFLLVMIAFACVIPYNVDSPSYHYLSILWSEKYPVIPGLANLNARYGTHSSFFVLCAAYSFTDFFGQAVYPANFVIVPAFFLWTLDKSYQFKDARRYFVWFILLILFRYLLVDIASPSHDALSTVMLFYLLYSFYDKSRINKPRLMFVLVFTAITLKLNTIPILLLIPFMFFNGRRKLMNNFIFLIISAGLVFLPWLLRGIYLSGYPLFPSTYLNFFNTDWKVPEAIAEAEKIHITMAPRLLGENFIALKQLSPFQWVPKWYLNLWKGNFVSAVFVSAALLSPFYWLIGGIKKERVSELLLFLIAFTGLWFWILTSPDIRFGAVFMLFCIFIPLSFAIKKIIIGRTKNILATAFVLLVALYNIKLGVSKMPGNFFSQNLLLPPKDAWYSKNNDLQTFRYIMLNSKVKLYIRDSNHHSINAPLPVYSAPLRPGIDTGVNVELRGEELQQGLRYKKRHN